MLWFYLELLLLLFYYFNYSFLPFYLLFSTLYNLFAQKNYTSLHNDQNKNAFSKQNALAFLKNNGALFFIGNPKKNYSKWFLFVEISFKCSFGFFVVVFIYAQLSLLCITWGRKGVNWLPLHYLGTHLVLVRLISSIGLVKLS